MSQWSMISNFRSNKVQIEFEQFREGGVYRIVITRAGVQAKTTRYIDKEAARAAFLGYVRTYE